MPVEAVVASFVAQQNSLLNHIGVFVTARIPRRHLMLAAPMVVAAAVMAPVAASAHDTPAVDPAADASAHTTPEPECAADLSGRS